MGNSSLQKSVKAKKKFLRDQERNYTHTSMVNDKRYGSIDVYKNNKSNNWIMAIKRTSLSATDYNQLINELDLRMTLSHPNLIHIYDFYEDRDVNLCGDLKLLHIFAEYLPYDLEQELNERTRVQELYTEGELWFMLECLNSAGKFLEQNGIYHGDFNPCNIHLTEEGFIKIADHGLTNPLINGYFKTLNGSKESYLAPELLESLASRNPSPNYNAAKADIFSIGMTILYMGTLINPINCFDYYGGRFDFSRLDLIFNEFSRRYSQRLCEVLSKMVAVDSRLRPNYEEMSQLINSSSSHQNNQNLLFASKVYETQMYPDSIQVSHGIVNGNLQTRRENLLEAQNTRVPFDLVTSQMINSSHNSVAPKNNNFYANTGNRQFAGQIGNQFAGQIGNQFAGQNLNRSLQNPSFVGFQENRNGFGFVSQFPAQNFQPPIITASFGGMNGLNGRQQNFNPIQPGGITQNQFFQGGQNQKQYGNEIDRRIDETLTKTAGTVARNRIM